MLARLRQIDPFIAILCTVAAVLIVISFAYPAKATDLSRPKVAKQKQEPFDPIIPKAAKSWTGVWIGVHGGYDVEKQKSSGVVREDPPCVGILCGLLPSPDTSTAFSLSSAADVLMYGAGIGYDHQFGQVVFGVSTDYSFGNGGKPSTIQLPSGAMAVVGDAKIDRAWYAGARLGWLGLSSRAMPFVSLGYTTVYSNPMIGVPSVAGAADLLGDRGGITYGGGIEMLGVVGLTLRAEYRFVDLGSDSLAFGPTAAALPNGAAAGAAKFDTNIHQFRLGVGYKFDSPIK